MRVKGLENTHLTYCLNVHAGETWAETFDALEANVLQVKSHVTSGNRPFGLGLRLSEAATVELAAPEVLQAFKDFLKKHNLYVFTVNGFPYGQFQNKVIKTEVYSPDWRDHKRLAYTCRIADILAELLPDGIDGSISTVPVSYASWLASPADIELACRQLRACVEHLDTIYQKTGRLIQLALEPEPDCYLEETPQVIRFFEQHLLNQAPELIKRYLGVCFDACHQAVLFEDLVQSLDTISRAGIAVPKIHISSALRTKENNEARQALQAFTQSPFLHQVKQMDSHGKIQSYKDLSDLLASPLHSETIENRIHCHVPLTFQGTEQLKTTREFLNGSFLQKALTSGVKHFEVETYTYHILPDNVQVKRLIENISDELNWTHQKLIDSMR